MADTSKWKSTETGNDAQAARDDSRPENDSGTAKEEKLKVVVRARPLQGREEPWLTAEEADSRHLHPTHSAPLTTLSIQENRLLWKKNGQLKTLKADAVFGGDAAQDAVFRSVADCVDGLLAGFDCSIFAYGQTGTGKTYTMSGLQSGDSKDELAAVTASHGIVPRSIDKLFARIEDEQRTVAGTLFTVYCSFIEIYNEKIYDVLAPDLSPASFQDEKANTPSGSLMQRTGWNSTVTTKDAKTLQIRQKLDGSVLVDGMTSRSVSSKSELLQAFREGSSNREVRDNVYNQYSSRGHSVFQITLRQHVTEQEVATSSGASSLGSGGSQTQGVKKTRLSRLFFVDLAGSEKWHVNGSELSDKYVSELASINKSLSALTNCVVALTQKERSHVPFRDSILTRLLQSCLQGVGRTTFIVTISPSKESLEESFATLRFAERLKALRCRPVRRSLLSNEMLGEQRLYYERQIQAMRTQVMQLRELLKKATQGPSEIAERSLLGDANTALVEENRRLKELLMQSERLRLVERNERMNGKSGDTVHGRRPGVTMSPQQLSARQMLNPTSARDEELKDSGNGSMRNSSQDMLTTYSIGQAGQDQHDSVRKENDQSRDQLIALETQLKSKEARLNWMLEAEMEAQNTGAEVSGIPGETIDSTPVDAIRRPTVTKSWAVETRLRRQLLAVPAPLRELQSVAASGGGGQGRLSAPTNPSIQLSVTTTSKSPRDVESSGRALPAIVKKSSVPPESSVVGGSQLVPRTIERQQRTPSPPMKEETRRNPSIPVEQSIAGSRRGRAGAALGAQIAQRADSTSPHLSGSNSQPEQAKSASILKLVGSSAGEATGKTREELVQEYKHARRLELEAMLRTMALK